MKEDTTTIRISRKHRDMLKILSVLENKGVQEIVNSLVEEYLNKHSDTLSPLINHMKSDLEIHVESESLCN